MIIQYETYKKLLSQLNPVFPEKGGLLGGKHGIITCFEKDKSVVTTVSNQYIPNVNYLNMILSRWDNTCTEFYGIVHTHPYAQEKLSSDDVKYIYTIMQAMPRTISSLYFPIVTDANKMISYKISLKDNRIQIMNDSVSLI